MSTRLLVLSSVATLLAPCASAPPEQKQPSEQPPVAFVEQPNRDGQQLANADPPVDGIRYWARPKQTADECLAEARAAGIDAKRSVEVSSMTELIAALGWCRSSKVAT